MATAENAKLEYESGQQSYTMSALTDSGDSTTFTSSASIWSNKAGFAPVIRPNGILTGGAVTPAAAAGNDDVDVATLSCNLNGIVTTVAAAPDTAITRPATNVSKVNSITINSSGAVVVIPGTDGSTAAFVETRGAAGGPPFIPVSSIEVAQVRVTSSTSAPITATEIYSVVGLHTETASFPLYESNYAEGSVTFLAALPAIHTGNEPKAVYASYAAPIFAQVSLATDFVAPETTHSITSTQIYGTTLGSTSSSLGQGSFTAYLEDGISDPLVQQKDFVLWFRFYPDRYKTSYLLCQGKLGVARTFPAGADIQAACTINAVKAAIEVA
jgi:hypothetical protein